MKNRKYQGRSILCSDQGFTLIELLVVVAIMSIAVGLASITYSVVHNANVAKTANTLDTAFNKARIQSMAKGEEAGRLSIWVSSGVMYYTIGEETNPTAVNSGVVSIAYNQNMAAVGSMPDCTPIMDLASQADPIVYTFNSAGVVKTDSDIPPEEWVFWYGTRRVRVIFYLETGKHMTELL